MADRQDVPWQTISVEAVAIVVSILLAFTIDAWWTEKKEKDIEREALQALHSDFLSSHNQLRRVIKSLGFAREDFAKFRSATPVELTELDAESVRFVLTSLVKNHTFDPVTANLDALANDGRLGLISDPELLGYLSKWRRELDDIGDISFELRAESVLMRRAMERHGGPFNRWRSSPDDFLVLPPASGETLARMRQDEEFMGSARSHQYALVVYLTELRDLEETLESTVASLEQLVAH